MLWMWFDSSRVYRSLDLSWKNWELYLGSYGGSIGIAHESFSGGSLPFDVQYYEELLGDGRLAFVTPYAVRESPEDICGDTESVIAYWMILVTYLLFLSPAIAWKVRQITRQETIPPNNQKEAEQAAPSNR